MLNLPQGKLRRIALFGLSAFFVFSGVNHFANTPFYVAIMPPFFPAPVTLVYISGVFEIAGGVGVLYAPTRRFAGWGLIALLVAIFPANIYMALNAEAFTEMASARALYIRLPIQLLFIAWVYYAILKGESQQ